MTDAYTVFWARDRCRSIATAAAAHVPLQVLFGGPHLSMPSFLRAKVRPGDLVYPVGVHDQRLYVLGRMRVTEIVEWSAGADDGFERHLDRFPHWRFLAGRCLTEVVLGEHGTRVRLDAAMPPEALRRLTYRSLRATRTVKHVSDEGRLVRSLGVQGIYRLAAQSVQDLDAVLAQPPGLTPVFGRRARTPTMAPSEVLI
ncbi:hypothetical protein [Micromonospora sp. NPDC051006]|uniref:hypothetical protein n=1 Tax=Micromonospora sp. NPDC051006 TaxID=3364283 RepID=UPI0037946D40